MPKIVTLADYRTISEPGSCTHDCPITTDEGAIRCTSCKRQLVMLPISYGEFRLEWLPSTDAAAWSCAA